MALAAHVRRRARRQPLGRPHLPQLHNIRLGALGPSALSLPRLNLFVLSRAAGRRLCAPRDVCELRDLGGGLALPERLELGALSEVL